MRPPISHITTRPTVFASVSLVGEKVEGHATKAG